mgnify:FL=1
MQRVCGRSFAEVGYAGVWGGEIGRTSARVGAGNRSGRVGEAVTLASDGVESAAVAAVAALMATNSRRLMACCVIVPLLLVRLYRKSSIDTRKCRDMRCEIAVRKACFWATIVVYE